MLNTLADTECPYHDVRKLRCQDEQAAAELIAKGRIGAARTAETAERDWRRPSVDTYRVTLILSTACCNIVYTVNYVNSIASCP